MPRRRSLYYGGVDELNRGLDLVAGLMRVLRRAPRRALHQMWMPIRQGQRTMTPLSQSNGGGVLGVARATVRS
jgi:hypothetical protein